ncbi:MAG: SGNH/GDSL hydrolase family protein [Sandaracinaceae bacterium]|nr:SGNH/GDSL hydrolase family protein [Sandaracinaceae bacterium]
MREGAEEAARALASDPEVAAMIGRLPLRDGARIVAFGDSHTSDPQSWAVILRELLALRGVTVEIDAVPGETTTHGLIRIGQVTAQQPDWILFLLGTNDARTQGPTPSKTLVSAQETESNLRELFARVAHETKARCLWMSPPPVNEESVKNHWGLSRFGVRFRNEDVARVAESVRSLGTPLVDLFALLGTPPAPELLMEDGLHLTLVGQKRIALEVLRGWSKQS